jgi:hypothetical protein
MAPFSKGPRVPARGARAALKGYISDAWNRAKRVQVKGIDVYRPAMNQGQFLGKQADQLERCFAHVLQAQHHLHQAYVLMEQLDAQMAPAEAEQDARKAARKAELDKADPTRVCKRCPVGYQCPYLNGLNQGWIPQDCPAKAAGEQIPERKV